MRGGSKKEKDTSQRYLLTYSDLMNLLLILFIVLYSMSKVDSNKTAQVSQSLQKALNGKVSSSQTAKATGGNVTTSSQGNEFSELYDQVVNAVSQNGMQNNVNVQSDGKGVVITLKDASLYAPGSATINTQGMSLMQNIGDLIKNVKYGLIMVEGHTDSDPIHNAQFQDNFDLSSARANNVLRVLISRGVSKSKIASMGRGDTVPVASNDTAEHKAQNRRVVVTIYKSTSNLTADQIINADQITTNSTLNQ